jgi:hypothetical protein
LLTIALEQLPQVLKQYPIASVWTRERFLAFLAVTGWGILFFTSVWPFIKARLGRERAATIRFMAGVTIVIPSMHEDGSEITMENPWNVELVQGSMDHCDPEVVVWVQFKEPIDPETLSVCDAAGSLPITIIMKNRRRALIAINFEDHADPSWDGCVRVMFECAEC